MAVRPVLLAAAVLGLAALPLQAQGAATPTLVPPPAGPPGVFQPSDPDSPDVWIFSGVLNGDNETYSGTLVSGKGDAQFEMRLADGATCDGNDFRGDIGMVRLSEIPCSDGRSMRALFIPQGGVALKVFGHVGDNRFVAEAHLLGTEPPPEQKQTAQPTVPQVLPPGPPPGATKP